MASRQAMSNPKGYRRRPSALNSSDDRAARPHGDERKQSLTPSRKSARLQEKSLHRQPERQEQVRQLPSSPSHTAEKEGPRDGVRSSSPHPNRKRKRKRSHGSRRNCKTEAGQIEHPISQLKDEPGRKRRRISPVVEDTFRQEPASSISNSTAHLQHWIRDGKWPQEYFDQDTDMSRQLTRKRSTPSIRGQPDSSSASIREGKNPAVKSRRYEQLLASAGIYMDDDDKVATTSASKTLCQNLLDADQAVPSDSLFNDDLFKRICQRVRNRNEARVIRDLSPLLVPSAEILHVRGATQLEHLIENVNESWSNSIPLVNGPRPQPDYSVGLKPTAFTSDQVRKLKPFIGDWQTASRLVATDEMYFPFLTSEVKCGNEALNIADRQNAHSASVAVNAVVELYRAVSRQDELHGEILTFSVSHDHRDVRIYGHYALINEEKTSFYRHLIRSFDIVNQDGIDKWMTYKFTRNVYDTFVPIHLGRILAAVNELPDPDIFLVGPLSQQSNADSVEQDDSQSTPSYSQESAPRLPSSQTTEPVFKKPRGKGVK